MFAKYSAAKWEVRDHDMLITLPREEPPADAIRLKVVKPRLPVGPPVEIDWEIAKQGIFPNGPGVDVCRTCGRPVEVGALIDGACDRCTKRSAR